MKKFKVRSLVCLAVMLALILTPAYAVEWKTVNQATIAWDPVTTNIDGDPIPAEHTIKYRVFLANATTDPNKENPVQLGETDQTQYLITLNVEGRYIAGVQSVRYDENGTELAVSPDINWSDVNGAATPNPFGFVRWIPPSSPGNLR